jgi:hypothetical protein
MTAIPNVREIEQHHGVYWCQLAESEPRVQKMLWRARQAGAECRQWSEVEQLFTPFRHELAGLLGFAGRHRHDPLLGSLAAYEVAHWKLYEAIAGLLHRIEVSDTSRAEVVNAGASRCS